MVFVILISECSACVCLSEAVRGSEADANKFGRLHLMCINFNIIFNILRVRFWFRLLLLAHGGGADVLCDEGRDRNELICNMYILC